MNGKPDVSTRSERMAGKQIGRIVRKAITGFKSRICAKRFLPQDLPAQTEPFNPCPCRTGNKRSDRETSFSGEYRGGHAIQSRALALKYVPTCLGHPVHISVKVLHLTNGVG